MTDVNAMPAIRSKVRLTICDALRAEYEGGNREPRYIGTAAGARHKLGVTDPARIERVEI